MSPTATINKIMIPLYFSIPCSQLYFYPIKISGYHKKDISIECDNGLLTITAEKKFENNEEDKSKKYIRRERHYGKVSRSFTFNDIDEDAIKADFHDGILRVSVPKKEQKETRKVIQIN